MSTIQSTESVIGAEIHPEIPIPHWVTERYLDDEGRIVKDESDLSSGAFAIQLNRMHSIIDEGYEVSDDNVDIRWDSVWEDRSGVDNESFTVLLADIPALIEALQVAQRAAQSAPTADVDQHLMEMDA